MQDLIRNLINPEWEDLSDYVVHFTRKTPESDCAGNLENILLQGKIEARTKFGVGRYYPSCAPSVCLSEVPILQVPRLTIRRSAYGVGFSKSFIRELGGGPLFYLNGERYEAVTVLMKAAVNDPNAPVWKLAPFIENVPRSYEVDWEREWRVPVSIPIGPDSVNFLLLPHSQHDAFQSVLQRAFAERNLPVIKCPLIDPKWPKERIREHLR